MRLFFTLVFAAAILTCQSQSTDLSLKLEKGKEYRQVATSKANITKEFGGQTMNTVMILNGTMCFLVREITDAGYVMDTKYEKISLTMQMPQATVEFNSEKNDPNDIFSTILSEMVGKVFGVTMTRTGKVTEITNVEVLWETIINQFDQVPSMQKEQIKAQIKNAYGTESMKGNLEMATAIYPEKPVIIGDKWTTHTKLAAGMDASMASEYELAELTSEYAVIKGNSTILTADKDAYIESNGMPMKFDLTGSMASDIKVDKNTGWIIEATINQEITGTAQIKENPKMPQGMKMPMTMKNEMVIRNK